MLINELVIGQKYQVNHDAPHHTGKIGILKFMGGPEFNVPVLEMERTGVLPSPVTLLAVNSMYLSKIEIHEKS